MKAFSQLPSLLPPSARMHSSIFSVFPVYDERRQTVTCPQMEVLSLK